MSKSEAQREQRNRLIGKIYDVILRPEDTQSFFSEWEKHISQATLPYASLDNTQHQSEHQLRDSELESHFSRAYAILEKMDADNARSTLTDFDRNDEIVFRFNAMGGLLESGQQTPKFFKGISKVEDIGKFLDEASEPKWKRFVENSQRAPELNRLHVFSMEDYGNLIAFNQRDETTDTFNLIVKSLKIHWTDELRKLLRDQFNLTNREVELLEELSEQGTLDQIVQNSQRSRNTLRTQIKSVFRKMSVRSQTEVIQSIALLAHFCDVIGFAEISQSDTIELGEIQNITLSHDVVVPVHFIGPKNGRPVLFIHGMFDGVAVTKGVLEALKRHNLRLISPVRPNFGMGPVEKNIRDIPQIVSRQLAEIVEKLALKEVLLLGHMSGSLYAFSAAKEIGDKAVGVVNVAGGIPIVEAKQCAKQSMRQKAFFFTARYAPAILPALMRAAMSQIDNNGPEKVMHDMYAKNTIDRIAVSDAEIANVVTDGYRFTIAQGYKGFEGDAYQIVRNWTELLEDLVQPVLLIHGAHDPVVLIDTVEVFARRENFQLEILENDGQLIFYSKPDDVLSKIARFYDEQAD